jgi:hypothetical protein
MLKKLNKSVAEAIHFAEEAERRAANARGAAMQADHKSRARGWRALARSFELSERLDQFLFRRRKAAKPDAPGGQRPVDLPTDPPTAHVEDGTLVPAAAAASEVTYRIWQREGEWLWEVSSAIGHNLGFGRAASSVHARVAAFRFWLEHK